MDCPVYLGGTISRGDPAINGDRCHRIAFRVGKHDGQFAIRCNARGC